MEESHPSPAGVSLQRLGEENKGLSNNAAANAEWGKGPAWLV